MVGPSGRVFGTEIVDEIFHFGEENYRAYAGVSGSAEFHPAGEELGLPEHAPFDRILVSASAKSFPRELVDQLSIGGVMVVPVESTSTFQTDDMPEPEKMDRIQVVTRVDEASYSQRPTLGAVFVPLIS